VIRQHNLKTSAGNIIPQLVPVNFSDVLSAEREVRMLRYNAICDLQDNLQEIPVDPAPARHSSVDRLR
jgi:hypothetical protein